MPTARLSRNCQSILKNNSGSPRLENGKIDFFAPQWDRFLVWGVFWDRGGLNKPSPRTKANKFSKIISKRAKFI